MRKEFPNEQVWFFLMERKCEEQKRRAYLLEKQMGDVDEEGIPGASSIFTTEMGKKITPMNEK